MSEKDERAARDIANDWLIKCELEGISPFAQRYLVNSTAEVISQARMEGAEEMQSQCADICKQYADEEPQNLGKTTARVLEKAIRNRSSDSGER